MDAVATNEQIARILRSQSFSNKSQLRKLLEVLHKNIDSQDNLNPDFVIKELWPTETRTKRSADVATEMNRLRHALETYYNGEGKADPVTIALPSRAASVLNGTHEKVWIVAAPRDAEPERAGLPHARQGSRHGGVGQARDWRRFRTAGVILAICGVAVAAYLTKKCSGYPTSRSLGG